MSDWRSRIDSALKTAGEKLHTLRLRAISLTLDGIAWLLTKIQNMLPPKEDPLADKPKDPDDNKHVADLEDQKGKEAKNDDKQADTATHGSST